MVYFNFSNHKIINLKAISPRACVYRVVESTAPCEIEICAETVQYMAVATVNNEPREEHALQHTMCASNAREWKVRQHHVHAIAQH